MKIDDPPCCETDTNFVAGVGCLTHLGTAGVKRGLSLDDECHRLSLFLSTGYRHCIQVHFNQ